MIIILFMVTSYLYFHFFMELELSENDYFFCYDILWYMGIKYLFYREKKNYAIF